MRLKIQFLKKNHKNKFKIKYQDHPLINSDPLGIEFWHPKTPKNFCSPRKPAQFFYNGYKSLFAEAIKHFMFVFCIKSHFYIAHRKKRE